MRLSRKTIYSFMKLFPSCVCYIRSEDSGMNAFNAKRLYCRIYSNGVSDNIAKVGCNAFAVEDETSMLLILHRHIRIPQKKTTRYIMISEVFRFTPRTTTLRLVGSLTFFYGASEREIHGSLRLINSVVYGGLCRRFGVCTYKPRKPRHNIEE